MSTTVFLLSLSALLFCAALVINAVWKERKNTYRKYIQKDSLLNELRKTEAPKERLKKEELIEA